MSPQLMVTGDLARAEAAELQAWMLQAIPQDNWQHFHSLADGLRILEKAIWIPDLVVFIQSWPDEYSRHEIDHLGRLAPLARWLIGYGSWCESDGRTRDIWPLAVRVPLHSAVTRLQREWQGLCEPSDFPLLKSASREETFAADHPLIEPQAPAPHTIVCSPDGEYRRYLVELLHLNGQTATTKDEYGASPSSASIPSQERHPVILFDLDPWGEERHSALRDMQAAHPHARILGLMNLPCPDDVAHLHEIGVDVILPKLGDQQRILEQLQENLPINCQKPTS
ncbi:MAG: hypothetical protein WCJ09_11140 [Planctomycetota bacterium]